MADQHMQCPQCGGELVILSDGKRECQSCKATYTVATNLIPDNASDEATTPAADKAPDAPKGVPVTDRYNRCPRCRGELFLMSDGKRQCQSCKTKYVLMPRSAAVRTTAVAGDDAFDDETASSGKKKKKKSVGVVIAVIVALLVIAAAGAFLANQYLFGGNLVGELFGKGDSVSDTGQLAGEMLMETEVTAPLAFIWER